MKFYVEQYEIWPAYSLRPRQDDVTDMRGVIEVDDDTRARWQNAASAFFAAQNEIEDALRESDRIDNLPKVWWSLVIRTPGSYHRHGFFGNEVDMKRHVAVEKQTNDHVESYRASEGHAREYQFDYDRQHRSAI